MSTLVDMEECCREIHSVLRVAIPPGVGYMLLLATHGKDGWMTYVSNTQRAGMVKMLRELLAKLEDERPEVKA